MDNKAKNEIDLNDLYFVKGKIHFVCFEVLQNKNYGCRLNIFENGGLNIVLARISFVKKNNKMICVEGQNVYNDILKYFKISDISELHGKFIWSIALSPKADCLVLSEMDSFKPLILNKKRFNVEKIRDCYEFFKEKGNLPTVISDYFEVVSVKEDLAKDMLVKSVNGGTRKAIKI